MNFWILLAFGTGVFAYIFVSYAFAALSTFWYHDYYDDEALVYKGTRPPGVPEGAFLVDLHCHTTASDGVLSPRQLVLWAISNGYNGVCVSDHNTMDNVEAVKEAAASIDPQFVVIPGVEFTSMRAHINLIGIKTPLRKPGMLWTRKSTIKAAIDHAHAEGGVVQFNHKAWYPYDILKHLPRGWWMEQGIDGWEVYNGFGFVDTEALDFIEDNKARRVMYASAGTDVHDPAKHKRAYTEILTDDRSIPGIITALKTGKTRIHLVSEGPRPEKGMLRLNPKKQAFIRKWLWLDWVGIALLTGKNTKLILPFLVVMLVLGTLLSIFM